MTITPDADCRIIQGDCLNVMRSRSISNIHLTFVDPPFNQGKDYTYFDDEQDPEKYRSWMKTVFEELYKVTAEGGSVYFMQREKNVGWMFKTLKETGWTFQNLIVWKKFTSAVPSDFRFGKQHQVIIFATKGKKPRLFNKLRIDYPLRPEHKHERPNGIYVTDVWDDIRELTSGYFAGGEALRDSKGNRLHTHLYPLWYKYQDLIHYQSTFVQETSETLKIY